LLGFDLRAAIIAFLCDHPENENMCKDDSERELRDTVLAKLEQDSSFMQMLERLSVPSKTRETAARQSWSGPPTSFYAKVRGSEAAKLTLGYINKHCTVPDMDGTVQCLLTQV
jgi:hypothetical protein